ncbi:hypothetical protein I3843_04G083900 [Carya illinoinensis]|nr:hypothetical protein I3843_04G083900 [Carya illinoinensis]
MIRTTQKYVRGKPTQAILNVGYVSPSPGTKSTVYGRIRAKTYLSTLFHLVGPNDTFYGTASSLQVLKMSGEEEENAAELKIGDEFLKAKCLMNCEVALILEHKYEQLQQMSDDAGNHVSQVFEKSQQYVKRFSRYKNPDAVRQVREYPPNLHNDGIPFPSCLYVCMSTT